MNKNMPDITRHKHEKPYPEEYSPQPNDINTERHFYGAFGDYGMERVANLIIRMSQTVGLGWQPFTQVKLSRFANVHKSSFEKLVKYGFLVRKKRLYYFTNEFIYNCHHSLPRFPPTKENSYKSL